MLAEALSKKIGASSKVAIVNMVLLVNAFTWYFYAFNFLRAITNEAAITELESLMIWGINFVGIAVLAIFGASMISRLKHRVPFLLSWMFSGVIFSLTPLVLDLTTSAGLMVVSAVFGAYFGLGMPICMGYFAASTVTENRSRLGGIIFLLTGLGFSLLGSIGVSDIMIHAFVLSSWRAVGSLILLFLKADEKPIEKNDKVSYGFIASNRSFILYFIPWCMFSLVNYLAVPVNSEVFPVEFVRFSSTIEGILAGIFAVVWGFLADFFGRKRLAVGGFAIVGLGYAVLGMYPGNIVGWWFYTIVDGIAWGAFYAIFLFTLWGDLAQNQSSDKYYAIGGLPYLISNFMRLSLGSYVADHVTENAVFSFASIFLFLAVLPLIYAPETLPEKRIRERQLKGYIKKAENIKQKYA